MQRKLTLAALIIAASVPLAAAAEGNKATADTNGAPPSDQTIDKMDRSTDKSMDKSMSNSTDKSMNRSTNKSMNTSTDQPKAAPQGERMGSGTAADAGNNAWGDSAKIFKDLDRDHDGRLTKDEAKASADAMGRFGELDTDHDGTISIHEWGAGHMEKKP